MTKKAVVAFIGKNVNLFTILLLLSHPELSKIIHCGLYCLFLLAHESKEVWLSQTMEKNGCQCP